MNKIKSILKSTKYILVMIGIILLLIVGYLLNYTSIGYSYKQDRILKSEDLAGDIYYGDLHKRFKNNTELFITQLLQKASLESVEKFTELKLLLILGKQSRDRTEYQMLSSSYKKIIPFMTQSIDTNLDILSPELNLTFEQMISIRSEVIRRRPLNCLTQAIHIDQNISKACGIFPFPNKSQIDGYQLLLLVDIKKERPIELTAIIVDKEHNRFKAMPFKLKENNVASVIKDNKTVNNDPKTYLTTFIQNLKNKENNTKLIEVGMKLYEISAK